MLNGHKLLLNLQETVRRLSHARPYLSLYSNKLKTRQAPHLGDDGHGGAQLLEAHLGDVNAVDDNAAPTQLLQPEQAVNQRALARARTAYHSAPRPSRYLLHRRHLAS
jgi:hypothetical protein